jgi:Putative zinc-finger
MYGAATPGCQRQRRVGAGLAILRCPRHDRSGAQRPTTPGRSPRALSPDYVSDTRALWDAAYLLGSLSSNDRCEFEAHLSTCPSCRESVTELSVMPALLAQLTRDDVAAIDERGSGAPPPRSPLLLTSPLSKVSGRRRRRSRLLKWAVAAAAVLAVGLLSAVQAHPGHRPRGRRPPHRH